MQEKETSHLGGGLPILMLRVAAGKRASLDELLELGLLSMPPGSGKPTSHRFLFGEAPPFVLASNGNQKEPTFLMAPTSVLGLGKARFPQALQHMFCSNCLN